MALCFTHTAAGYLAYEAVRPAGGHRPGLLVAAVALANAPDLDFVPGLLLGHPAAYHRGVTHTLVAAVVVAAVVAWAVRWRGRARPVALGAWAGATYGSHLLLDFFTVNVVPPHGARFLWPFSDRHYLAPVTPLPEIVIDPTGPAAFFGSLVAPHTAGVWVQEAAVLALVVAAVQMLRAGPAWAPSRDLPGGS